MSQQERRLSKPRRRCAILSLVLVPNPARLLEAKLQAWLMAYLEGAGCTVRPEQRIGSDYGRADLLVKAEHEAAIEIKGDADRGSLCTALGQALVYCAAGAPRVGVVAPEPLSPTPDAILAAFEASAVPLLYVPLCQGEPPRPGTYSSIVRALPHLGWPWGHVPSPYRHLHREEVTDE